MGVILALEDVGDDRAHPLVVESLGVVAAVTGLVSPVWAMIAVKG